MNKNEFRHFDQNPINIIVTKSLVSIQDTKCNFNKFQNEKNIMFAVDFYD